MFQRFHAMKERTERGFTLIELLVVILIIAILAAIAIPAFLAQRKKGWVSQQQSALKNAATAAESYATGTGGDYSAMTTGASTDSLEQNGFNHTAGVTVTIVSKSATGYCLKAVHNPVTEDWQYNSADGEPVAGDCVP